LQQQGLWSLVAFTMLLLTAAEGYAQQTQERRPVLSAGLLAGPTSGLSFHAILRDPALDSPGAAADLAVSFNGEGFLHLSGHSLTERILPDTPLRLFLGPGMVTELDDGTLRWGLSTTLGGYFLRGPYEVLLSLMPRFMVVPERNGIFGAAVGVRYRF
jgi:hypothetical protein